MKLGRKGFMLAEVVVVAVVIATVLVTLFTGLSNVSSAYETRNRYYDVDSLYIAMEINEILIRNNFSFERDTPISLDKNGPIDVTEFVSFYYYKIGDDVYSYFIPYDKEKMLSLETFDGKTDKTFDDYLEYLSGNLDFEADYNYMIIVERRENKDIDDCYYYALKLKY